MSTSDEIISDDTVTRSTGNVFRDIGLPNPDLLEAKSNLLDGIRRQIETGAVLLGDLELTDEQESSFVAGRLGAFTLDDLWRLGEKAGLRISLDIEQD